MTSTHLVAPDQGAQTCQEKSLRSPSPLEFRVLLRPFADDAKVDPPGKMPGGAPGTVLLVPFASWFRRFGRTYSCDDEDDNAAGADAADP